MSERDQQRLHEISRGALVARMAGSIALATGVAVGFVTYASDLDQRSVMAVYAAMGVFYSAAMIFVIARWIRRRVRRRDT